MIFCEYIVLKSPEICFCYLSGNRCLLSTDCVASCSKWTEKFQSL